VAYRFALMCSYKKASVNRGHLRRYVSIIEIACSGSFTYLLAMHFIVIIIGIVLFFYWRFFRPRQLEVLILAFLSTFATMTLVAVVTDDVKLAFMFVLSFMGWGRLFTVVLASSKHAKVAAKLRQFLGRS